MLVCALVIVMDIALIESLRSVIRLLILWMDVCELITEGDIALMKCCAGLLSCCFFGWACAHSSLKEILGDL